MFKQAQIEELMLTLREAIPSFKQRTTVLRNRLSKLFTSKVGFLLNKFR